jgi:pyridoxamine 5'-phosphate oxidase
MSADPFARFLEWYAEAERRGAPLPEAMTLATATAAGRPSARTVLYKGLDERGFLFFTNYESRKGLELAENPRAALVFHWHGDPRRQVLVQGTVEKVSREESRAYFDSRERGSRIAASISRQSRPIESRQALEHQFTEAEARLGDQVPLPDWWGGYVLAPESFEFWESRPSRLHDRVRFTRDAEGGWRLEPLAP